MEVAEKAASFIRRRLYNEQTRRLQHSFRNGPSKAPGFLDDYAFLISGLLDLYEFGGETHWLVWAIELQEIQARINGLVKSSYPFRKIAFYFIINFDHFRMSYFSIERVEVTLTPRGRTLQFSFA